MISQRNIGVLLSAACAGMATALAGGAGNGVKTSGAIIDRLAKGSPESGVLLLPFEATLAAGETLTLSVELVTGETANLADGKALMSHTAVVATGPAGGGTVSDVLKLDQLLSGAGRYIRLDFTPTHSAGATDAAAVGGLVVMGGGDRVPA